jgi:hypothetical protein
LHRNHLEDFTKWLDAEAVPHRPGKGSWQALQVFDKRHGWLVIHYNNRPEHLTIDSSLYPLVKRFISNRIIATPPEKPLDDIQKLKDLIVRLYNVPDLMFLVDSEDGELAADVEATIEKIKGEPC